MNGELSALIARMEAILTEIKAVVGADKPKKVGREEYLGMNEEQRMEHDKSQMDMKAQEEDEEIGA